MNRWRLEIGTGACPRSRASCRGLAENVVAMIVKNLRALLASHSIIRHGSDPDTHAAGVIRLSSLI
jgi:hypothetical protein